MPKGRKLTPSAKPSDLFEDIRALIEQARAATARVINSTVTLLYWQVGQRFGVMCSTSSERNMASRLLQRCRDS